MLKKNPKPNPTSQFPRSCFLLPPVFFIHCLLLLLSSATNNYCPLPPDSDDGCFSIVCFLQSPPTEP